MRRILPMLVALLLVPAIALAAAGQNFTAHLSADEEVPPNDSLATGQTKLQLSRDGSELGYKLIVANIENVLMAHIHCGPAGENGPIVAWLYPDAPPPVLIPGRTNGILAQGTITEDDVVPVGDSPVCPGGVSDLDDLLEKLRTGGAYVNVHTSQFPGGEVRGQIAAHGPHA